MFASAHPIFIHAHVCFLAESIALFDRISWTEWKIAYFVRPYVLCLLARRDSRNRYWLLRTYRHSSSFARRYLLISTGSYTIGPVEDASSCNSTGLASIKRVTANSRNVCHPSERRDLSVVYSNEQGNMEETRGG